MKTRVAVLALSLAAFPGLAAAADAGAFACKTTEECAAQAAKIGALRPCARLQGQHDEPGRLGRGPVLLDEQDQQGIDRYAGRGEDPTTPRLGARLPAASPTPSTRPPSPAASGPPT